jgi:hypothetical protein
MSYCLWSWNNSVYNVQTPGWNTKNQVSILADAFGVTFLQTFRASFDARRISGFLFGGKVGRE